LVLQQKQQDTQFILLLPAEPPLMLLSGWLVVGVYGPCILFLAEIAFFIGVSRGKVHWGLSTISSRCFLSFFISIAPLPLRVPFVCWGRLAIIRDQ
jgi:hypothetical protein